MEATKRTFRQRPRVAQVLPTQCLACDAEAGYRQVTKLTQVDLKGETFAITHDALVCHACGHAILSDEQMDARVRLTVAAYQTRHGLLTAEELVERRKALGYATQQALADAAPMITIATLKRVEAGQHVQDPGTNFILRKALEELAEKREDRTQAEILAFLREDLPAPREIGTTVRESVVAPGSGWLGAWATATLPLAACLTVMATTPASPRLNNDSVPPMEVASGC